MHFLLQNELLDAEASVRRAQRTRAAQASLSAVPRLHRFRRWRPVRARRPSIRPRPA